jgi:hypothetical protein
MGAEIAADAAAHLDGCVACRLMFDEQRRLIGDLDEQVAHALAIEPSPRFVSQVMARVESSARPALRWQPGLWWIVPAAAAAVLILAVLPWLRSGKSGADVRPVPSVVATKPPAPAVTQTPPIVPPAQTASDRPRPTGTRRQAERRVAESRRVEVEALVADAAAQSRALSRYLALVRSGALDTSALAKADDVPVLPPADLVIVPLSIRDLATTNGDSEIDPSAERSAPRFR